LIIPVNFKGKLSAKGDFETWLDLWIKHVTTCLKTVGVVDQKIEKEVNEVREQISRLLKLENDRDCILLALDLPSSLYPKVL
jgi:hypothetical protein